MHYPFKAVCTWADHSLRSDVYRGLTVVPVVSVVPFFLEEDGDGWALLCRDRQTPNLLAKHVIPQRAQGQSAYSGARNKHTPEEHWNVNRV